MSRTLKALIPALVGAVLVADLAFRLSGAQPIDQQDLILMAWVGICAGWSASAFAYGPAVFIFSLASTLALASSYAAADPDWSRVVGTIIASIGSGVIAFCSGMRFGFYGFGGPDTDDGPDNGGGGGGDDGPRPDPAPDGGSELDLDAELELLLAAHNSERQLEGAHA